MRCCASSRKSRCSCHGLFICAKMKGATTSRVPQWLIVYKLALTDIYDESPKVYCKVTDLSQPVSGKWSLYCVFYITVFIFRQPINLFTRRKVWPSIFICCESSAGIILTTLLTFTATPTLLTSRRQDYSKMLFVKTQLMGGWKVLFFSHPLFYKI